MIQGIVKVRTPSGETPLPRVRVSNGRDVTLTDESGCYTLDRRPEDQFVFVTVPSGYSAESIPCYHRIDEGDFDFLLEPDDRSGASEFSFVQITDIHMSVDGSRSNERQLVEDLNTVYEEVGDRASFIVATGDLTNKGTKDEFDAFLRGISESPLPVYPCIGNHDDNDADGDQYTNALGPTYYSFDYGHVHFVAYAGVGRAWREPDHQGAWVQADLGAVPPETPVVVLIHFPWGDHFYDSFRDHNIIATFSGHWHCARVYDDAPTIHYNTPTFCFGGIDQSPRAYRFCTVREGTLTSEIRALDAKPFRGASFRPASTHREPVTETDLRPIPDSDWPLFRGRVSRTGEVDADPDLPLEPAWTASSGGGLHQGSPILVGRSLVVGTQSEDRPDASGVVALDAISGRPLWDVTTSASIKLSPAAENGRLFATTVTGEVIALDPDGRKLWSYQTGDPSERWVYSSPLAWRGSLYTGMTPHYVSLDQATGGVNWLREDLGTRDWIASYPSAAGFENFLMLAFYGQTLNLAALDAETGATVWTVEEEKTNRTNTTPVVGPDGLVYIVGGRTNVRAFEISTGESRWSRELDKTRCAASPALSNGRLFVPDGDGGLTVLDAHTGEVIWSWTSGAGLGSFSPYVRGGKGALSSPVVTERFVLFGSADGHLYGLTVDSGEVAWVHDLGVPTLSSPVVSGGGLWTGSCDGMIHAFASAGRA